MRLEEIQQQFRNEFVLIEVTKTDAADETAILEGNVLAHSKEYDEITALMVAAPATDVAIEWCGEIDPKVVVVI